MSNIPTMDADELKKIRTTFNYTQKEMSELLGVALKTYKQWEYQQRKMPGPAVILVQLLQRYNGQYPN